MALPKEQTGGYTYGDYRTWSDDERWELIDGVAWSMSPAPTPDHQSILLRLTRQIANITDRTGCATFVAPLDVRLSEKSAQSEDETPTVVQPDISVFCDPSRLDEKGAHAAPDLVVEILSPSTGYKDQTTKLALYERHAVREYWVVNGDAGWVMVYRLGAERRYGKPDYYRRDEAVRSDVLGGAEIATCSFLAAKA
ncbi:MAG: Uma2 family endonuclease [Spirochaetaceae bacterium]|nr:MAG: Uma2 family endonuclease [Spirochaetaceae bacterium]